MRPAQLTGHVKNLAAEQGFDRCRITPAQPIGRADYFRSWLASGRAGSMEYLHRHIDQRTDPKALLPGAQSVVVVALLYNQPEPPPEANDREPRGRVAKYAWGDDYHKIVKRKLFSLVDALRDELPEPFDAKVCVDTAPLIEREVAAAAGVGWIGKNTMVLDPHLGSYFFLGEIVTTLDLEPDEPMPDHCGSCTACLDACPTDAFPAPYEMDASRCISYLTIENRGEIPAEFHGKMDDWIFGCDICQAVCPFNRQAPTTNEPAFAIRPPGPRPPLSEIRSWSIDDYRKNLRNSAIKRAKLQMLHRNADIAISNRGTSATSPPKQKTGTDPHA